MFTGDTLALA